MIAQQADEGNGRNRWERNRSYPVGNSQAGWSGISYDVLMAELNDVNVTRFEQARAYGVHLLTASGIVPALLAAIEISADRPRPVLIFGLLAAAVGIDAIDGPLARAWGIKVRANLIDGRKIDDIVDYITYTFIPLLLVWRMGWLPHPAAAWIAPALLASLLGFANVSAKQESAGFFVGFPSYWNIWAIYAGIVHSWWGGWPNVVMIVLLTLLTVLPVRFIYPNLAPWPWRKPVIIGGIVWAGILVVMMPFYPRVPIWLMAVSLVYPVLYAAISVYLDRQERLRQSGEPAPMS